MNYALVNKTFYKKSILFLANIILNTSLMVSTYYIKSLSEKWMLYLAIISLIQFCINTFTVILFEKNLFTLTTLFMAFSYVTHLGMLLIHGFNINISLPWDPLISISINEYKEASCFTIYAHSFLAFGMVFILFTKKNIMYYKNEIKNNFDEEKELHITRVIGLALVAIGIVPMLYIDLNRIYLYINYGYLATYNIGANGFVSTIGRMTEIGILMLIISYKHDKKKVIFIILTILLYQCMVIFTGNRGRPVMYLITIFYVYFNMVQKIKLKELATTSIFAYIFGFILTFVGQMRSAALADINTYIILAKRSFIQFSPFKILAEFGMTIITLARSMSIISDTNSIKYGTTYLLSIFTIFPNLGGSLNSIIKSTVYVNSWPQELKQSIGGSYLGEIYWNFGEYSFVFIAFIGMFIAFVSNQVLKWYHKKRYVYLSIYLILFPNLLWWVRDYFMSMVREFVWISIIILLLYDILKSKLYNKST